MFCLLKYFKNTIYSLDLILPLHIKYFVTQYFITVRGLRSNTNDICFCFYRERFLFGSPHTGNSLYAVGRQVIEMEHPTCASENLPPKLLQRRCNSCEGSLLYEILTQRFTFSITAPVPIYQCPLGPDCSCSDIIGGQGPVLSLILLCSGLYVVATIIEDDNGPQPIMRYTY